MLLQMLKPGRPVVLHSSVQGRRQTACLHSRLQHTAAQMTQRQQALLQLQHLMQALAMHQLMRQTRLPPWLVMPVSMQWVQSRRHLLQSCQMPLGSQLLCPSALSWRTKCSRSQGMPCQSQKMHQPLLMAALQLQQQPSRLLQPSHQMWEESSQRMRRLCMEHQRQRRRRVLTAQRK